MGSPGCTGLNVSASLMVVRLTGEVVVLMVKLVGSTGLLDVLLTALQALLPVTSLPVNGVHYFYSVQMNNKKNTNLLEVELDSLFLKYTI